MKILQINKFWFTRGGTETHLFSLISLLKKHGHKILAYSQKNKNNRPANEDKFFISEINLDKFYLKNIFKIGRIFWSPEARRNLSKLIKANKPDVVHIHNIYHQISPSILPIIKQAKIPIVMTVHDFKLISPDYTLWPIANHRPAKSLPARILMALEHTVNKITKVYKNNIDTFIVPSQFVYDKLVKHGFDKNKIVIIPHFQNSNKNNLDTTEDNYFIYFGRLDHTKGADVLIRALALVKNKVPLKIVGSGPQEMELKKLVTKLNLEYQVQFISHCNREELDKLIAKSMFTVFPSLVHETFGMGIIESYNLGKPVIASDVGAFSENIDKSTGILCAPGNVENFRQAIETLSENNELRHKMSKSAKAKNKSLCSPESYYHKVENIYTNLIRRK
jgi:glycosyltransferase involved in cell wall biosynthesis